MVARSQSFGSLNPLAQKVYPLVALVGQETLKQALLIAAVNPLSGGVLIRGEKGTAKSTAARGLPEILPPIVTAVGCAVGCEPEKPAFWCPRCRAKGDKIVFQPGPRPFLTLPLNATEDRVVGGLDFETALSQGVRRSLPGLLAEAHRGILYIDEVNLLDDHLVDIILDAAASGLNVVEREGLSLSHPAEFTLIGTMNPEEGELRPQFLDRFGLSVQVESEKDLDLRVRLTLSREEFEANPAAFREKYAEESAELKAQVARAVEILPQVATPLRIRQFIAQLCAERYVAGHRADIYLERAAQTLTALKGRRIVSEEEVLTVAPLVLAHRQRDLAPPPPPQSQPEKNPEYDDPNDSKDEENEPQSKDDRDQNDNPNREDPNEAEGGGPENGAQPQEETLTHQTEGPEEGQELDGEEVPPDNSGEDLDYDAVAERVFEIGQTFRVKRFSVNQDRFRRRGPGRRSRTRVSQKRGRSVKSGPNDGTGDIALDATIRAAAPYQKSREKVPGLALSLRTWDIRSHVREKKMGHHIFFVVDASGSMGARGRMAAAKGAIMSILLDAYQKRDQVALVSFRRYEAALNLPLTSSVDLAGKLLAEMPTGGRTPLSQGLALTFREVKNVLVKNPLARPIVILITDGRGNVGLFGDTEAKRPLLETWDLARLMAKEKRVKYLLVDTEEHSLLSFNMAARLAEALGAEYFQIDELKAETLLDIVKKER